MMEGIRTFIIAAMVFVAFLLWQAWEEKYAPVSAPAQTAQQKTQTQESLPSIPSLPTQNQFEASTNPVNTPATPAQDQNRWVHIKTDVLTASIDTLGGSLVHLSMLDYHQTQQEKEPLVLFNTLPGQFFVAESGLVSDAGPDIPGVANVREQKIAQYQSAQKNYSLGENDDKLTVTLTWKDRNGLSVEKEFTFYRGQYVVDVAYHLHNKSSKSWAGSQFMQFKRDQITQTSSFFTFPSYFGAAISSPEKRYEKITFADLNSELGVSPGRTVTDGWLAMVEHYFLGAWIPDPTKAFQYEGGLFSGNTYFLRAVSQPVSVPAGADATFTAKLYGGPKITDVLKEVAPKLDLTVDYGWLWPISQALFWVMDEIHKVISNWGWSIVIVTLLIKLAFYKLSATSYRSMANMRRLQPKFVALKERYGDDKQKMSQELMALYKKEKINPLGGCLPILVQIPVFIALYWVLIESVEFRQAPFMLWIQDLSVKDPYYVLPLLMGLTMFIQQKLSPQPPDPLQAKVMMFMPILFTVIFLNFPAGLVLYWLVNNMLSIAQQWYITKKIEAQAK